MRRRNLIQRSSPYEEALINITPLIDVVFVLLIIFIIIAPLVEIDQIELAKGGTHAKELSALEEQQRKVVLHIKKNNQILLNKEVITTAMLRQKLIRLKEAFPKEVPMLIHDKQAYFGTYQEIKNAVEEAGFDGMDLLLAPK